MIAFELLKTSRGSLDAVKMARIRDLVGATCFIETGTYLGDTVEAMRSVFERVVSIELSPKLHAAACARFAGKPDVILLQGDSAEMIGAALDAAQGRHCILWLDAHFSGGVTARGEGNTPILEEIRRLREFGAQDLTILVDDVSYFWPVQADFPSDDSAKGYPPLARLVEELRSLNPEYRVFVNGDVLFAIPAGRAPALECSTVLDAMTKLRVGGVSAADIGALEGIVAAAKGAEREAIVRMPDVFERALASGIGGHFCYWRGLVLEQEHDRVGAARDFAMARRCGIDVRTRPWEASLGLKLAQARARARRMSGSAARRASACWAGVSAGMTALHAGARDAFRRSVLFLRLLRRNPTLVGDFVVSAACGEGDVKAALAAVASRRQAMRGFRNELSEFNHLLSMAGRSPVSEADLYPCLDDRTTSTEFDRHYVYHPAWAARVLARWAPEKHIDISSTLHFCSIVSAFIPVEFYDYRPANLVLSGLECGAVDLKDLPFADASVESISCMHVLEHIGLGRYGDEFDVDGDVKAARELARVTADGGRLLVVLPVGHERIQFNAHRIYSHERILEMFSGLVLEEFALIPDGPADDGLIVEPTAAVIAAQKYGCGCYLFTKPGRNHGGRKDVSVTGR